MQKAIIDLSKNGIIPVFHAKQGDTSRRVAITLLDNGLPYDTAADAVSVWYRGPSGEGNYSDGIDKDGSTLTILVNPNMTAASGRHTCAVMLSNESGRCTTWNFCVEVAYTPALGSEEAKAYFEAFEAGELAADIAAVDARTAKAVAELNARVSAIIASGTATEGNTELIDIRTGADGKVYPTAGDAVREQVGGMKGDLANKVSMIPSIIIDGKYVSYKNGALVSNDGFAYTEMSVFPNCKIKYRAIIDTPDSRGLAFYDANDNFISGFQMVQAEQDISIPENARIVKATIDSAEQLIMEVNVSEIAERISDIEKKSSSYEDDISDALDAIYIKSTDDSVELTNDKYISYKDGVYYTVNGLSATNILTIPKNAYILVSTLESVSTADNRGIALFSDGIYVSGVQYQPNTNTYAIQSSENTNGIALTLNSPSDYFKIKVFGSVDKLIDYILRIENNVSALADLVVDLQTSCGVTVESYTDICFSNAVPEPLLSTKIYGYVENASDPSYDSPVTYGFVGNNITIKNTGILSEVQSDISLEEPLRAIKNNNYDKSYGNVTVDGIGYLADELFYDIKGTAKIIRNIAALKSPKGWKKHYSGYFYLSIKSVENCESICTHFPYDRGKHDYVSYWITYISGNSQRLLFYPNDVWTDVESFETWIDEQEANGTPLVFYYKYKNPKEESLSADQIESLAKLKIFEGNNTISISNAKTIQISYLASLNESVKGIKINTDDISDIKSKMSFSTENPIEYLDRTGGYASQLLKIGCIGDSLSSGEHVYKNKDGSTGYIDLYQYSYGQFMARTLGVDVLNFSRGGLTTKSFLESYAVDNNVFTDDDKKCCAYTIALGVNDSNTTAYEVGSYTDSVDAGTFCAYYNGIIAKIKETQPKAKIFCLTMPNGWYFDSEHSSRANSINDSIRMIANNTDNCYLCDMAKYAQKISSTDMLGSHMTSVCYQRWAWELMTYINRIITDNPTEFSEIGFIGTDYNYN